MFGRPVFKSTPVAQLMPGTNASAESSLPVLPIEHIEKAVLGRVQQHLAGPPGERQVHQRHVGDGVEVPAVPGVSW